jgi:hypothetical protein
MTETLAEESEYVTDRIAAAFKSLEEDGIRIIDLSKRIRTMEDVMTSAECKVMYKGARLIVYPAW